MKEIDYVAELASKIEELEAEKQKFIDDKLESHGAFGKNAMTIKLVHDEAAARYDGRIASLKRDYNEVKGMEE